MTFTFRPAVRENVNLLIGLAGSSGSGKTYSALELATGLAAGKRFAVIDTERGRARHYADQFAFDVVDLGPPFRPEAYQSAIEAAEKAGYPVIVIDSASHEHAGEGGLLDWHEEELDRLTRGDQSRRDAMNQLAWVAPKVAHKKWVQHLLQVKAHLILCFRAEEKTDRRKNAQTGKTEFVPKEFRGAEPAYAEAVRGWGVIAEKNMMFEMTLSLLMLADNPGVTIPIKLQAQHRPMIALDKPLTRASGEALGAWARGGKTGKPARAASEREITQPPKDAESAARLTEALTVIAAANSVSELKSIAATLAKTKLIDADRDLARAAYKRRMAEVSK